MATAGEPSERVTARARDVGQEWAPTAYPTEFLSLGGLGQGIPIRATVTSFGPTLLAKVLGLNETQESSLGLVFHYADKNGLALLDIKDLRAVISHLTSDEGKADLKALGGLSSATAGVILRELITFSDQGADVFFGEPEFDTSDLLRTAEDGRGLVTCLELPAVQDRPKLFSTFLMWMLADLFHDLPEVGDLDKPKLVFFFDEAHLLFDEASRAFEDAIEQTVRLIRSKGVGVFFVTQSPKDVPADVLAQLGNRVQHALRAFTPDDAKALKAAVSTYPTTDYDLSSLLTSLGTGEAVVTVLSERGAPTPVAWTRMIAPQSLMAPSAPERVASLISGSGLAAKYAAVADRESAYEKLQARMAHAPTPEEEPAPAPKAPGRLQPPSGSPSRSRGWSSRSCSPAPSGRCCARPGPSSGARSPARCSARPAVGAESAEKGCDEQDHGNRPHCRDEDGVPGEDRGAVEARGVHEDVLRRRQRRGHHDRQQGVPLDTQRVARHEERRQWLGASFSAEVAPTSAAEPPEPRPGPRRSAMP